MGMRRGGAGRHSQLVDTLIKAGGASVAGRLLAAALDLASTAWFTREGAFLKVPHSMGKVCRKAWREDVGGRNSGRRGAAAAVGEKGGMSVRYEGSSGTAAGGLRRT
jgi:hypothetical protein